MMQEFMVLVVVVVGVMAYKGYQAKLEIDRQSALKHDEEYAQQRARGAALGQAREGVRFAIDDSKRKAAQLPSLVVRAEAAVDRAEFEFNERAYVPFWSAIEEAAAALADYNAAVLSIGANAAAYASLSRQLRPPVPQYELGTDVLPSAARPVHRMQFLVREAQKD